MITVSSSGAYAGFVSFHDHPIFASDCFTVVSKDSNLNQKFLFHLLKSKQQTIYQMQTGGGQPHVYVRDFDDFEIPLPPIALQQNIVDELEINQKIIDGCKQVIENYKPSIEIDSSWKIVELDSICDVKSGGTPSKKNDEFWSNGSIPWVGSGVCKNERIYSSEKFITSAGLQNSSAKVFPQGTTFIALVGATIGKTALSAFETSTNQNIAGITPKDDQMIDKTYLFYATQTLYSQFMRLGEGQFRMANLSFVRGLKIPLPSMETQKKIVSQLEAIEKVVDGNKNLIEIYTQKTQDSIRRVWGD